MKVALEIETVIAILSATVAVYLFLHRSALATHKKIGGLEIRLTNELANIRTEQSAAQVKVDVLWEIFREHMADALHRPHAKRRDELIDKTRTEKLTDEEAQELKELLEAMKESGEIKEKSLEAIAFSFYMKNLNRQLEASHHCGAPVKL